MRKELYFLLMLLAAVRILHAQSPQSDSSEALQNLKRAVVKMQEEYKTLDKLHLIMSVQVFESDSASKPYFSEIAIIRRDKNNYLYRFGTQEMLMNEKYLLMIDRSSKEIFCNTRSLKSEVNTFKDAFQMNIDSLLQFYGKTIFMGEEDRIEHFRLFQDKGDVSQVDLFIDTSSGLIKRFDYSYRDKQYVKIDFRVFDRAPIFEKNIFSETNYVIVQEEKLVASEKFKGYNVSDVNQN